MYVFMEKLDLFKQKIIKVGCRPIPIFALKLKRHVSTRYYPGF